MTEKETLSRFDRRKQRTHQDLKQAALDLVLEKGYDAVTIQDIVDRADYGRGTFYLHFDDKEALDRSRAAVYRTWAVPVR